MAQACRIALALLITAVGGVLSTYTVMSRYVTFPPASTTVNGTERRMTICSGRAASGRAN